MMIGSGAHLRGLSGIDANQRADLRSRVFSYGAMVFPLLTLVIDGFPLGSDVLREFGARPTNFFLAAAFVWFVLKRLTTVEPKRFSRKSVFVVLVVAVGVPALNIPVTLLEGDVSYVQALPDWFRQYAMFTWAIASFWIWRQLLKPITVYEVAVLVALCSVLPLAAFFADMTGAGAVTTALEFVRIKRDERLSGMATEPSLYVSWMAFNWPLVMYFALRAGSKTGRFFGIILSIALWVSAYLSNARTIAVIAVLQIAYLGSWVARNSSGLSRIRALFALGIVAAGAAVAFAASLASLTTVDIGSNVSRIGSTVTSISVALAHPVFGTGIGQLRYFFGAYAPDFALANDEIFARITDTGEYRASSFNLFVRLCCEFGFAIGLAFSAVILAPIVKAVRLRRPDTCLLFAVLAAIGGVGFWLSADQFGYQPAILSLAILSKALIDRTAAPGQRIPEAAEV